MAAGDTFRAAASEQLEVWAERTGSEIVVGEGLKPRPATVLAEAVRQGVERDFDLVLCDTSGRKYLHTSELFCTCIWLRAAMHNDRCHTKQYDCEP
jgi:fused signal recognition particle receptor